MNKIAIIDDYLDDQEFEIIKNTFYDSNFPWYYNDYKSYSKTYNQSDKEILCDDLYDFQFTHTFYKDFKYKSNWDISPIVNKMSPSALIRIKANLTVKTKNQQIYGYHCDVDESCFTAIYYLNTNNGRTIFEDGTEIKSVKNRIVVFNSQTRHTGTSCTDKNTRMVLNFNFY